ncbi:hypothetical protein F2Q70_00045559 [Brassica cretica]|uniref:Uncharacterized protein n=1 Tax=Brassica cretica TaxID=69181 RepID=A0A8S9KJ26_BRACR|nr:hypothetical protein F2Q70_00045559 [Brassica cretica]
MHGSSAEAPMNSTIEAEAIALLMATQQMIRLTTLKLPSWEIEGQFIIGYCGEVILWKEAKRRAQTCVLVYKFIRMVV